MGKVFAEVDGQLADWIGRQKIFFVATAPLAQSGHVNLSPKGYDTLRLLSPTAVAYLDTGGSGTETIAHIKENSRITIMLCAFEGPPRIVRLHGLGTIVEPGDEDFEELLAGFPEHRVARSVVRIELTRIADSCGFGVPLFDYQGERDSLDKFLSHKKRDEVDAYFDEANATSIDGLPARRVGARRTGES
ncbi:MAG: pyridoxamine 5'-phosphate oxidase family protein [Gammaproteobacteria bacterium]|nr:pyridoxamine 5'-phosphate oxidase family protein [Gammaproteobacteria bacterium]NNM00067.1 pyridoxamine 5'-phosphate oxidase family protein [Gammaproteobacteria bacterium]